MGKKERKLLGETPPTLSMDFIKEKLEIARVETPTGQLRHLQPQLCSYCSSDMQRASETTENNRLKHKPLCNYRVSGKGWSIIKCLVLGVLIARL